MSTTSGIYNMRAASMPKVTSGGSGHVSTQQKIGNLFQQIDSNGTGRITKAQFEQAFEKLSLPASVKGIGSEAAFSKLDPSGTGGVTKQDFIKGMSSLMAQKTSQPHKEASLEIKSSPLPKGAPNNFSLPNPSLNLPQQSAGGSLGNTINITA